MTLTNARRARTVAWTASALIGLGVTGMLLSGNDAAADKAAATPLPAVTAGPLVSVTEVTARPVSVEQLYAARTEGARRVEVRARVQGILMERGYREGAFVKAGDVLFRIDPERFEVQVQRAEGELARARATQAQAQRDWARVQKLYRTGTLSERDHDQAQSTLELARADVTVAEAAVRDARIQLDYTAVKAPISGIASLETFSEGNLVQEQSLLTTITQLDPIHVQFSLSERDAIALRQRMQDSQPSAELLLPDGSSYEQTGLIDFADSAVDAKTGKVLARAVFPNADGEVLPGQFVRISLERAALASAIVVPSRAVAQGSGGPMVWVVNADDVAEARPVELGQSLVNGVVVTRGLQPGERVVVEGIANLHTAGKVRILPSESGIAAGSGAALSGQRSDGSART